jgi:hypothetical protein
VAAGEEVTRKKIQPRPAAPKLTVADGRHRTLLYCDDSNPRREGWGWWCRDCLEAHDPDLKRSGAERSMERHKARELARAGALKREREIAQEAKAA